MCLRDLSDAKQLNLKHRLLRGGLPPFFLAEDLEERDFQEWIDAYWAKDIQELSGWNGGIPFRSLPNSSLRRAAASSRRRGSPVRVK